MASKPAPGLVASNSVTNTARSRLLSGEVWNLTSATNLKKMEFLNQKKRKQRGDIPPKTMQLMRNRLPLQKSSLPDQRWLHNCFLKKLWISYEKFQMLKKISHHCLLFSSPPPRDATLHFRKSNGVVNHEFAEVYTVRASSPFSALHGGVVLRFLLWKFRPPYTRADSENCSAGLYICLHEKKRKKMKKKVCEEDKEGGKGWSTMKLHGEKETH